MLSVHSYLLSLSLNPSLQNSCTGSFQLCHQNTTKLKFVMTQVVPEASLLFILHRHAAHTNSLVINEECTILRKTFSNKSQNILCSFWKNFNYVQGQ
jgi:hypothetical protein